MEEGGTDAAVRKNLLDRLLNAVKQVINGYYYIVKKGGGVFADSADFLLQNVVYTKA